MLDRRAMFAHGMPMVRTTSPDQVCLACHRDAAAHKTNRGHIPCPACGDRLQYRLRTDAPDREAAISAHCQRSGCIAILG